MLFDSYIFIFAFLPFVLFVYHFLTKYKLKNFSIYFLIFCSLSFYGWWNPKYLPLLVGSVFVNFLFSQCIIRSQNQPNKALSLLAIAMATNIAFICYFKYLFFIVHNLSFIFPTIHPVEQITLPLGISFFTFQNIALLVDIYRKECRQLKFRDYFLFISFFPQLIAGPIVQQREFIPQLKNTSHLKLTTENISKGGTIFILGLCKKVVLADSIAVYANAVFNSAESGTILSFWEAWCGSIAYGMQLYFDFSGYSDMAIGLGLMFGIKLPMNFNSPYKANSIIEFWKRWHMTLSAFLKEYLYIPLGGNRCGKIKRYMNLMLTMLLGGLWHGANWTFVLWGLLHGSYLIINHLYRHLLNHFNMAHVNNNVLLKIAYRLLTFASVIFAWVAFRASNIEVATSMMQSMLNVKELLLLHSALTKIGLQITVPENFKSIGMFYNGIANWNIAVPILFLFIGTTWLMPNTAQLIKIHDFSNGSVGKNHVSSKMPTLIENLRWQPNLAWSFLSALAFLIIIIFLAEENEFLYFQF